MPVRPLTEADFAAALELDSRAFGFDLTDELIDTLGRPTLRSGRNIGAYEDDRLVSLGMILSKSITLPGRVVAPVAAVTWISVSPDRGGRGLLRELMQHQLHGLHDTGGEAIAALTASESGIYGRFGYGVAVEQADAEVAIPTTLHRGLAPEPVREQTLDEALALMREIYERVRTTRIGYLTRDDLTWFALFTDVQPPGRSGGKLRIAVHPDGYLAFRVQNDDDRRGPRQVLQVRELCAATPAATVALWAHVLRRPLARELRYPRFGPGEVLRDLLVDPRAAVLTTRDHVWIRLVDLDRALGLRRYRHDVRAVLEVRDAFCPWNAGRWLFEVRDGVGTAVRTDAAADVTLDIAELGAAYLGGQPLSRLAAAGLVTGDVGVIEALDAAFLEPRLPYCPEGF